MQTSALLPLCPLGACWKHLRRVSSNSPPASPRIHEDAEKKICFKALESFVVETLK
jgi:hypothetical protein